MAYDGDLRRPPWKHPIDHTILHRSREACDGHLEAGMEAGSIQTGHRLNEHTAQMSVATRWALMSGKYLGLGQTRSNPKGKVADHQLWASEAFAVVGSHRSPYCRAALGVHGELSDPYFSLPLSQQGMKADADSRFQSPQAISSAGFRKGGDPCPGR